MTAALLGLAALLATTPVASAALQDNLDSVTEDTYLRGAVGDIPRTSPTEPAGQLNLVLYLRMEHTQGTETRTLVVLPTGAAEDGADCTCGGLQRNAADGEMFGDPPGSFVALAIPTGEPSGSYVAAYRYHVPHLGGDLYAFTLDIAQRDARSLGISLYVPQGSVADSDLAPSGPLLPSTAENPGFVIYHYEGTPAAPTSSAWFVLHPGTAAPAAVAAGGDGGIHWLELGLGALVGVLLWAFLVGRGMVQRRGRREVRREAVHEAMAGREAKPVLEARKRALLAALKELEVARMAKEMGDAAYDAVKADLKRQAVAVMRALEEGDAKPDAP